MATDTSASAKQPYDEKPRDKTVSFLDPVEKPTRLALRILYWYARRQWGTVPRPFSVFCARMPLVFGNFFGKVSRLDRKLVLPGETAMLIRGRVAATNMCNWCVDAQRWYALNKAPQSLAKLDALDQYRTNPLFDYKERAALDFATELTNHKRVSRGTFAELSRHYSEREVCDIVWLVSSEHLYNLNNLGLNIGSDGLCEVSDLPRVPAA